LIAHIGRKTIDGFSSSKHLEGAFEGGCLIQPLTKRYLRQKAFGLKEDGSFSRLVPAVDKTEKVPYMLQIQRISPFFNTVP